MDSTGAFMFKHIAEGGFGSVLIGNGNLDFSVLYCFSNNPVLFTVVQWVVVYLHFLAHSVPNWYVRWTGEEESEVVADFVLVPVVDLGQELFEYFVHCFLIRS